MFSIKETILLLCFSVGFQTISNPAKLRGLRILQCFCTRWLEIVAPTIVKLEQYTRQDGSSARLNFRCGLRGARCRLFIPEMQQGFFDTRNGSNPRLRTHTTGPAPFPVFVPFSRCSAFDTEVAFLDRTDTMRDFGGEKLAYIQIVCVKPSEVEKYRRSAPYFVVMELQRIPKVKHVQCGDMKAEDLGVGCARTLIAFLERPNYVVFAAIFDRFPYWIPPCCCACLLVSNQLQVLLRFAALGFCKDFLKL